MMAIEEARRIRDDIRDVLSSATEALASLLNPLAAELACAQSICQEEQALLTKQLGAVSDALDHMRVANALLKRTVP